MTSVRSHFQLDPSQWLGEAPTFDSNSPSTGQWSRIFARRRLGLGEGVFDAAADRLMTWQMHAGVGLRVAATSPRASTGVIVQAAPRLIGRPLITCRVTDVVDAEDARGFTYVTLGAHPLQGLESFLVHHGPDGTVHFTVQAVARPRARLLRPARPLVEVVERLTVRAYARALVR